MKGSFRSRLISGMVVAWGLLLLSGGLAAAPAKAEPKEKSKAPAILEKDAPATVSDLRTIQEHVKKVLAKVVPAVVGIHIGGAAGSGVIIDAEGHVLTAGHVSGKPDRDCFLILPDGRRVKGKTLGRNNGIDSGMIKITEKGKWKFAEMGDSAKLKTGQWCLSVGHPGGFKPGRSPVVRLGRVLMANKALIQSDCTLVGGDSGGPLFNMDGKVIGIHSRIGPAITANIHVPVNTYRDTWDRLAKGESWGSLFGGSPDKKPGTAYLGIGFSIENDNLEITDVYEGTPAAKAGLKVGDLIAAIDGKKITKRDELAAHLKTKKPDDEVSIEVQRDKKPLTLKVKLGKRPSD
jgi:serine protease Do